MHRPYGIYEAAIKRLLDVILSAAAIIILSPVGLIVAFLVRIKLGTPIIFSQERPGKNEKIFRLYKFRSMTDKRDAEGKLLPDSERMTSFGRMLRKTSLDELPELFNILRGDMSIVGPRPLLIEYLPYYNENEKHRHDVRPGLTGLAQVSGRNMLNWADRFKTDVEYVNHITFAMDAGIVLKTIKKTVIREGILEDTSQGEPNFAEERKAGSI